MQHNGPGAQQLLALEAGVDVRGRAGVIEGLREARTDRVQRFDGAAVVILPMGLHQLRGQALQVLGTLRPFGR